MSEESLTNQDRCAKRNDEMMLATSPQTAGLYRHLHHFVRGTEAQ
jgi:hypothetical protein